MPRDIRDVRLKQARQEECQGRLVGSKDEKLIDKGQGQGALGKGNGICKGMELREGKICLGNYNKTKQGLLECRVIKRQKKLAK